MIENEKLKIVQGSTIMIKNFNSGTGLGNNPENIISGITAKLSSKISKAKSKKSNINTSTNDSNLNQNLSEFGKLMIHSDESALSSAKTELKIKSTQNKTQINKNVLISQKPLSEINNLIGELSNLIASDPEAKVQFGDSKTEDKFLDLIIDNFEDLLGIDDSSDTNINNNTNISPDNIKISDVYEQVISNKEMLNISLEGSKSNNLNINNNSIENINLGDLQDSNSEFEFSSEYDILNPLSGLEFSEMQNLGIKFGSPNSTDKNQINEIESFIQNEITAIDDNLEINIEKNADNTDKNDKLNINPYLIKTENKSEIESKNISSINSNEKSSNLAKNTFNEIESFIQNEIITLDSEDIIRTETVTNEKTSNENVVKFNVNSDISSEPNVNNIKYKLKDLIGIIREAMKNDIDEENDNFSKNIAKIQNKDYSETNYIKDSESRIKDMVEKNTRKLVDNFLPKYFYKSINNLKNNTNENSINSFGKNLNELIDDKLSSKNAQPNYEKVYQFGEKLDFSNTESYIKELNNLESKLTKNQSNLDKNSAQSLNIKNTENSILSNEIVSNEIVSNDFSIEKPNSANSKKLIDENKNNNQNEKYNIQPSVEFEPKLETKVNTKNETIEETKKKNDIKTENTLNNLVNINTNSNEIKKSENIINRSNSLEFQSFNDIKTDELIETTAKATLNTNVGNTSMVRITMNPTALGTVFVEIKMNGDNAELNFKASDKDVINTLENNIAELQETLRKENVEIKSLIIDYKNFSDELNKDGQNKQNNENQQQNKNNQNKALYKDLQDVEIEQSGISLDKSFYNNLKNFAGSIRDESPIYKEVGKMGGNLETIKIKSKVIEKYM